MFIYSKYTRNSKEIFVSKHDVIKSRKSQKISNYFKKQKKCNFSNEKLLYCCSTTL